MTEASVGIFVDYESPLARKVAETLWSGLSRAALQGGGHARVSTFWEGLEVEDALSKLTSRSPRPEPGISVIAIGQDRPDAIDSVSPVGGALYGLIVAVPQRPSPLSGPLLYQGVERLKEGGVRAGDIEPALLAPSPEACEAYARRLLERLDA